MFEPKLEKNLTPVSGTLFSIYCWLAGFATGLVIACVLW